MNDPHRRVTWHATSNDENSWPRSAALQSCGRSRRARSKARGCGALACSFRRGRAGLARPPLGVLASLAATGLERRRQRPDRDPHGQGQSQSAFAATAPEGPGLTLALPDKPSIAVLPFQNMSGDSEQEYFADGIVEDIITG